MGMLETRRSSVVATHRGSATMNRFSYDLSFAFVFYFLMIAIMAIHMPIPCCESTSFAFNGFRQNMSEMRLSGIAALDPSGLIQLTNFSSRIFGHALYHKPLLMKNNGLVTSFATTFVFSITPLTPVIGGHGLAFFMAPFLDDSHYTAIQYMGLLNYTKDGNLSNHLFAVEFDIFQNVELQDINDNHVGINLNSMRSVKSVPAAYYRTSNQSQPLNLKGGQNIQAWINYDGLTQQLNVSIANVGQPEPLFPLLSTPLANLSAFLQDNAYVGFSAGTGSLFAVHRILAWSFNNNGFTSPLLDLSQLPRLRATARARSVSRGAIAGFTLFAVVLFCVVAYTLLRVYKRRQKLIKAELLEDWGLELNGPHRFSYKELTEATNGFAEEQLVGKGGFGVVFRGILPSTGDEVAVKRLSNQSQQGVREFMAELSSMSRLSHRNLVQLQGWCRRRGSGELLLVIDYMPNGSLDQILYRSSSSFSWAHRYTILKDVASALVYLHEEWEQKVIHRDVKSNNILLDANLNARLGDFGLARLHDHGKNSHTTRVVGTLGYLAPEYTQTGKATASCDVFSFGAVMLEVACGRRPLEVQRPNEEERVLVNWVLGLLLQGRLLEASDPKLCSEYVKEEMECVLKLGLFCSNPNPAARPMMRQVLQILMGVAPLPLLPPFKSLETTASLPSSANSGGTFDTSLALDNAIISHASGR